MDTLSHYLWTVPFYWKHPKRWWLGLIGAAPDLVSFGLLILLGVFGVYPGHGLADPHLAASIPSWVYFLYDLSHSLVICVTVLGLLWLLKPGVPLLMIGWPLHIVLDIPTHTRAFFPTPFLWPISDLTIDALSWSVPWYFMLDWALLAVVYAWLVLRSRLSTSRHHT